MVQKHSPGFTVQRSGAGAGVAIWATWGTGVPPSGSAGPNRCMVTVAGGTVVVEVVDVWAPAAGRRITGAATATTPDTARPRLKLPASIRRTGPMVSRSAARTRCTAPAARRPAPSTVTAARYQRPPN